MSDYLPCPFCGSSNLTPNVWSVGGGEVDAVECEACFAGAPVTTWNERRTPEQALQRRLADQCDAEEELHL